MSCTTKSLYQSIESCPGSKNNPGIRRRLYYAPKSWIAAIPKLPDTDDDQIEDMSAFAQLVGDFTFELAVQVRALLDDFGGQIRDRHGIADTQ